MAEEEEEEIMMEEIPLEIITERLSLLPPKSLRSNFKFVCKSCRTVIQDPVFVKMHHLNRGAINGGGGGGGSKNSKICKSGWDLFQVHPPLSSRLRGSCSGLVFMSVKNSESVVLVNPKTEIMAEEEIIMEEIPSELSIEILSWLPTKSLLSSFKFVCKSWRTVIQDPDFVKMHLNRGAINGGGGGGRSNNSLICKSGRDLFQVHPPFNFEGIPTITPTYLDFPSPLMSRLCGSFNGLLFLSFTTDEIIILVNPCTRKFKVSPEHPIKHPPTFVKSGVVSYGFGCCYNSIDNIHEYKVIRIVAFSNSEYSLVYEVDIYYMSSDSWRRETRFRDYPYAISDQQSGVFVNGALHWMGYNNLDSDESCETWDAIVSFHVRDEEFRLVPVPLSCEPTADDPYFHLQDIILMNMKGCLSMIRFSQGNNSMNVDLEIWVMKEYGIKKSWIKEFVIRSSNSEPLGELSGFVTSRTSNAYYLKGDQILIEGAEQIDPNQYGYREKLVLYDIDKRKIDEDFKMVGVPDKFSINQVDYIETLVSLKSSTASFEQQ